MSKLHIHSICSPFDEPGLASATIEALRRADTMGLQPQSITCLDDTAMQKLQTGMAETGIGHTFRADSIACRTPAQPGFPMC